MRICRIMVLLALLAAALAPVETFDVLARVLLPKVPRIAADLAQLHQDLGDLAAAARWHQRAAALEPDADAKLDSLYSIGVLAWRRLNEHPEIAGAERRRIADEGIAALDIVVMQREERSPTLMYLNLLYRERALGQPSAEARAADVAAAVRCYQLAEAAAARRR